MRSVRLTSLVVVVVVLAVLLVNCGRSRDEPAAPTLSTELTTSTTLDPFAVPETVDRITKVTRLITASRSCIYTQVERDYRPVAGSGGVSVQWVGLRPAAALEEFRPYNPTHWIYTADGFQADRSQPPNPCTGS